MRLHTEQTDDIDLIPDIGNWFLIVTTDNGSIECKGIIFSKIGAREMLDLLKNHDDPATIAVFYIARSKRGNEVYRLDPENLAQRLEQEIPAIDRTHCPQGQWILGT
ncbi:hypothetical protein [uncultured Methanolobus sp.]|uniref:hypothetical protein n=1 Tax=uncultured Methanolobus sp. TaxID=218300 RepID=UPI0029C7B2ED|nr:hypothetical protein [uncultured Methanolobus sp.]